MITATMTPRVDNKADGDRVVDGNISGLASSVQHTDENLYRFLESSDQIGVGFLSFTDAGVGSKC